MKKITIVSKVSDPNIDRIITDKVDTFNKLQHSANEIYKELCNLCKIYPDFAFDVDVK